jgi:oligo-1,6-glucosidase
MDHKYFENNAVYQIYPRSFCDSNGDGIGDIPGITSKLDYLASLGIGIIWLSPIYPSPNIDYGYDISDYEAVNPEYGTMADMDTLIAEAKKRNIRIVMDLVVNHTSDQHKWFQESKKPNSPYRDYYYWREGKKNNTLPPNNWTSDFGGSAWEFDKDVGMWYLHLFSKQQVDLNWHNPKVLEEVENILRFWLDKGIYGFRCDVINQIYKENLDDGKKSLYVMGMEHYLNKDGNHEILKKLNADVFSHYDCMTVGETYNVDYKNARRFTDHELDMVFQFDLMGIDKGILPLFHKKFKPGKFKKCVFGWQKELDWNANYLENHDQLRSIPRFGNEKRYWKESGKMLATYLLTARGTPYIFEGEEIGMLNYPMFKPEEYVDPVNTWVYKTLRHYHFPKKRSIKLIHNMNRDNARTPMQWDATKNSGFSSGNKTWLPVNPNYAAINVAKEEDDPNSILAYYRQVIALRKSDPTLSYGDFTPVKTSDEVMAYYRTYEGKMDLIVLNLTGGLVAMPKCLRSNRGETLLSVYPGTAFAYKKKLRPYEGLVVRIH